MQGAYNSALVAQGAFSAYWTEDLRAVGGWPDAIGEDIVLTWTMMDSRGIVAVRAAGARRHHRARPDPAVHDAALPLGPRDVRGHQRQAAVATAASAGEGRRRHRLPGPVPGHRLRVLLDPRRDPVPVRLPADLLVVVDARCCRSRCSSTGCCADGRSCTCFRPLPRASRARPPRVLRLPARSTRRWPSPLRCAATPSTCRAARAAGSNGQGWIPAPMVLPSQASSHGRSGRTSRR